MPFAARYASKGEAGHLKGMKTDWTVAEMPLLRGLRFLITGANSGIGYQAALELARRGGVVVMACRDRALGEAALARLRREVGELPHGVGPGTLRLRPRNSATGSCPRSTVTS